MAASTERVVLQCKMHRGIFILPAISVLTAAVPFLAFYWLMSSVMTSLNPSGLKIHLPWLLMLLPGLGVGLMLFLVTLIEYLKSEIVLTEDRLKFKVGWLSVGSTEMLLSKIETITLFEPLLGRLVGYGTVAVTGTGGTSFRLRFLPNPQHFHRLLQTTVNNMHTSRSSSNHAPTQSSVQAPVYDESRYMPKT